MRPAAGRAGHQWQGGHRRLAARGVERAQGRPRAPPRCGPSDCRGRCARRAAASPAALLKGPRGTWHGTVRSLRPPGSSSDAGRLLLVTDAQPVGGEPRPAPGPTCRRRIARQRRHGRHGRSGARPGKRPSPWPPPARVSAHRSRSATSLPRPPPSPPGSWSHRPGGRIGHWPAPSGGRPKHQARWVGP